MITDYGIFATTMILISFKVVKSDCCPMKFIFYLFYFVNISLDNNLMLFHNVVYLLKQQYAGNSEYMLLSVHVLLASISYFMYCWFTVTKM